MYADTYTLTPMVPLRRDCDAVTVVRKFEFVLGLLDLCLTNSAAFLGRANIDTLLEWISGGLIDVRDHKHVLAEPLQDEIEAVERAIFATLMIARYNRQAKSASEPPSLREAAKGAVEYWKAVAREACPNTPRAERIVTLLKLRYGW